MKGLIGPMVIVVACGKSVTVSHTSHLVLVVYINAKKLVRNISLNQNNCMSFIQLHCARVYH